MKTTCITLTYGRVERLNECLESFLRQDYPDKSMLILNTCPQQTLLGNFPNVKIVNLKTRPSSLGMARNIAVEMAEDGLIVTLDDDDMALPHYLSVFAGILEQNPTAKWIWADKQFYLEGGKIKKIAVGMMNTFVYTKEAWKSIGGYDHVNVGEDRNFAGKLTQKHDGVKATITPQQTGYLYCWANGVYHISGLGDDKPKQMNSWERARRDLEMKIMRGLVKKGNIQLQPKWQRDYVAMANSFIGEVKLAESRRPAVCMVELGRYGDIINILPVARILSEANGKPAFMVSREFADVLDGVSYVTPHVVDFPHEEINKALTLARSEYSNVVCCQIWGNGYKQARTTPAYNLESWTVAGFGAEFNDFSKQPLFDLRNPERELAIYNKLSDGRPLLLLKLHGGRSSPFPNGAVLEQKIRERYGDRFQVVELTSMKCDRIYDLLGLLDRAALLVTIDTSILHLAAASFVPTVALLNPLPWLGTIPRCNCACKLTYDEAGRDSNKVLDGIELALNHTSPSPQPLPVIAPITRRLLHAVERHEEPPDSRKAEAWRSWDALYQQGVIPCHYWKYRRTAADIKDKRALPYLKDVLQFAMDKADDEDIIFLTNDDNVLHRDLPSALRFHVATYGACSSQRCEFRRKLPSPDSPVEVFAKFGGAHMGRDLFAFTKRWLLNHWDTIPDFILGASDWDLAMAAFIRLEKGLVTDRRNITMSIFPSELNRGYVSHVAHHPQWSHPSNHMTAPSQIHNRKLFREWARKRLPKLRFNRDNVI